MRRLLLKPRSTLSRIGTLFYLTVQFALIGALLYHVPLRHLGISLVIVVVILTLALAYQLFHPKCVALDERASWEQENFDLRERFNAIQVEHLLDRLLLLEYVEILAQNHPTTIYRHFDLRKTRIVVDQGIRKLEFDWFNSGHRIFLSRLETYPTVTVIQNTNGLTDEIMTQD